MIDRHSRERAGLSGETLWAANRRGHTQFTSQNDPLAGLVPAIHVFETGIAGAEEDVGGRDKPGQGVSIVAWEIDK